MCEQHIAKQEKNKPNIDSRLRPCAQPTTCM